MNEVPSSYESIICWVFESNGLEENMYVYKVKLEKGCDFIIPKEVNLSDFVCVFSIGIMEEDSRKSYKIDNEYSKYHFSYVHF